LRTVFAGRIAQEEHGGKPFPNSAREDEELAAELLAEMCADDVERKALDSKLRGESKCLVLKHQPAIRAVAAALLKKPYQSRVTEPNGSWSDCQVERRLDRSEIVEILREHEILPNTASCPGDAIEAD
jgi:broad specificity phosphatase PhoE